MPAVNTFRTYIFTNAFKLVLDHGAMETVKHSICMMMTVDDLHLSNRERIWITFAPTDGGHVYEHFSFEVGITLDFADFFSWKTKKKQTNKPESRKTVQSQNKT